MSLLRPSARSSLSLRAALAPANLLHLVRRVVDCRRFVTAAVWLRVFQLLETLLIETVFRLQHDVPPKSNCFSINPSLQTSCPRQHLAPSHKRLPIKASYGLQPPACPASSPDSAAIRTGLSHQRLFLLPAL